ncbi:hypothetical protein LNQ81_15935 [Myroides sp. M-43]|uniref:hypothetical protein n=1 Tax=Myroides oncorhynchi TaxID=2893756 RepID=UPI001E432A2C|nr:hypothetical protein [Myroides oncorhynchi]MCC9044162.1 hypothetical protein [Myroides oncorhynchi]
MNEFELAVLNSLAKDYPFLKEHIPYLRIKNREITGVGMYVNFVYSQEIKISNRDFYNVSLSTNENIEVESLEYGLGFELDITDGKVNFIEFITYGENWDGVINKFKITKYL